MSIYTAGVSIIYPYIYCSILCVETGEFQYIKREFRDSDEGYIHAVNCLVEDIAQFDIRNLIICSKFDMLNNFIHFAVSNDKQGIKILSTDFIEIYLNSMLTDLDIPHINSTDAYSIPIRSFHCKVLNAISPEPDRFCHSKHGYYISKSASILAAKYYCEGT